MLKEFLKNQKQDNDSIKHDKDKDKSYIDSLEKELERLKNLKISDKKTLNEIKELEIYIDEKKTIYLTQENLSKSIPNYSELSDAVQERLKIFNMLQEIITSYFNQYDINCKYEFNYKIYLNKFNIENNDKFPTIRYNDNNFLVYDRNNEEDFFSQLKKNGENIESWKSVIDKYITDKTKDKFLFTYIKDSDYDKPLIIKNDNVINYLFKFPIPQKNKDDQFIRICQNFFSKTILGKYTHIDKSKEIIFSWNVEESNENEILFLEF